QPPARDRLSDSDAAAMRAAAVVRVTVAVVAAAVGMAGATRWGRSLGTFFLLIGVVWLPWTVFLLYATASREGRRRHLDRALYGGPVGDVAILFAAQILLPWAWGIFLLADALAVSLAASLWRSRPAWALLGACVLLTLVAQGLLPAGDRQAFGLLALFALAMAGLVVVVGRIARDHRMAAVTSHRFQQKAETILARVADGIVVTDSLGIVLEANPAGERLMGHSVVGVPCGRALGLHEGEREFDCYTGCPLLDGPDAGIGQEVWRQLPDGRRQPLLASAFAVSDERGGVEVVHSFRDITRLKEADEAKTLFLATASHELKTPVTVIAGFAETILAYPTMPPERRAEAVEAIRRRAMELSSIVDRLLLSSKIEGGRVHVDIHPVDVRTMVIERSNAFQDATGRHIVTLVAGETLVAEADPLALQTVVDHLLDNAVKYSDGGPVVIAGHRRAGMVEISVSDIGIGMDEEQARRCFDKFWQAESTDVRRFGGTGIGLYIVSSLVDAMGGEITVETAVGRGSTFTVALPVMAGADEGDTPEDSAIRDLVFNALSRGTA
ncbi:MAG TPA: PAS domain-containing sensor histidine kinase, partial [Acidimicrobiales bacterium]|nr:PAS domain-containing sensor histidine kinase [Acidimicrobiales bacterium]